MPSNTALGPLANASGPNAATKGGAAAADGGVAEYQTAMAPTPMTLAEITEATRFFFKREARNNAFVLSTEKHDTLVIYDIDVTP